MSCTDSLSSTNQRPELVFALVGGTGTRLNDLSCVLKEKLETFRYQIEYIKLSDLLHNCKGVWAEQKGIGEAERIKHLQNMGTLFRKKLDRGDALALAGINEIQARRSKISGSPDKPAPAYAYILHQLKHPAEVDLLRQVYGPSFLLIAGHAPRRERIEELSKQMARAASQPGENYKFEADAIDVIEIDDKQEDNLGQNVRDTYPKADFFANLGRIVGGENEVQRFVDLLFGHPFRTPNPNEYAMYLASAASLRSSDDNRQVGAVIVGRGYDHQQYVKIADVIAVGMNEVPRGGGGFYWGKASPDGRDQYLIKKGEDRAFEIKNSMLTELIKKIDQKNWLQDSVSKQDPAVLARDLLNDLGGTQFLNIGEFSRPVHAEMAALIDAARRGVAVNGHSMYVTTFPCHNCAKHIIAAGIRRVVYLEPYPKSRAFNLYHEEIAQESAEDGDKEPLNEEKDKVAFFAFSGIAPRQYPQLFSMSERGAKSIKGKPLIKWEAGQRSLEPLYVPQNASLLYLEAERQALANLPPDIYDRKKNTLSK